MKQTFVFVFILFISQLAVSQNITIENKYLELINRQNDKFIISDNIRNAELCADSLLHMKKNDTINSIFLSNLAESYYLIKKYDFSIFTILRQKCLFPNKNLENNINSLLIANASKLRQSIDIQTIINTTSPEKIQKLTYEQRLILLFQLSAKIYSKKLNHHLLNITNIYQSKINKQLPFCMAQFRIFYFSKMPFFKQKKYLNITNITQNYTFEDLISNLPQRYRDRISKKTRKTII